MRQIFVLSLPLLLAACLGDRQAPPPDAAVMPPDHWREETTAGDPVDAQWWNSFGDPVLSTLVGRALEHNPKIEQAAANVAQARAKLRVAQASQGPELDFRGIGGRTKQLESTGPITTWGAETEGTLDYDFDLFGRLASAKEAARAEMLASKASADAVKLAIAGTVASAYIALLGDDRRLAITEDTLAARQASLDLERRLATTGYASQLELRQAEAEYRSTEQLVPQAKLAVTETENAISVLIGVPPSDLARESRGLERLSVPTVPAILPSELMRRRPDIFAAEEQVVAADHSYDSARAAMLPDFSLTGRSEAVFATVLPDPENAFLLGGSVLAPPLRFRASPRCCRCHGGSPRRRGAFLSGHGPEVVPGGRERPGFDHAHG